MIKLLFLQVLAWTFLAGWFTHLHRTKLLPPKQSVLLLLFALLFIGLSTFDFIALAPLVNVVH